MMLAMHEAEVTEHLSEVMMHCFRRYLQIRRVEEDGIDSDLAII